MANVKKFTRAASGHLCAHYERAKDENGEYIKFGNQDIDITRTPENYNLAPVRGVGQNDFIQTRCGEVQCMNRKDVNVMCSWVVTAPKDLPEKDERRFFEETYKFLSARYGGEKNVVSSYVHMDEKTPHMHFAFVPVVADRRKGKDKVSAKECVNRTDLQTFHQDLENHLAKSFGRELGVLNEATKDGNKSIAELKRGQAIQDIENAWNELEKVQSDIKRLQATEKGLQAKLEGLQGQVLTMKGLEAVQPEKTITGAVKGVSVEQVQDLKKTAMQYHKIKEDYQELKREYTRAKAQIPTMEERLAHGKTESENRQLREKLKKAYDFIDRIPDGVIEKMNKEIEQERREQSRRQDWEMEL